MTFLAPLGLLSLLVLPLILVLHLIRRRRRPVRVPSLQLWSATDTEVQRKRRRLPLTLLLALHLVIAAIIALALGRPRMPGAAFNPIRLVVILDTSGSMATEDGGAGGATRFAAAQAAARDLLNRSGTGDRISVVTLGADTRLLGRGGPEAASALGDAVAALRPGGPDGDLRATLELAAVEPDASAELSQRVVVLTDPSYHAPAPGVPAVTGAFDWRTFGGATENLAVVAFAARPLRAGGHQLYARVANFGQRQAAREIEILLDGKVAQSEPIRLDGGAEMEWSWPLPRGTRTAEARLTPGDAAPRDNQAAAVLAGGTQRRVQLVSANPTPLERSLRALPGVEVSLAVPESYQHDPNADAVVFVDYVPPALPPAPTLLVAPPRTNTLVPVIGIERDLRADSTSDRRFAMIDLRSILFGRVAQVTPPAWASASVASDDVPLILTGIFEDQPRTIWTFDPSDSNLAGRLAFPLLTAASLRTLLPASGDTLRSGEPAPQDLVDADGAQLAAGLPLSEPGLYRWANRDGLVAVNAIEPSESDLRVREPPEVIVRPEPRPAAVAGDDRPRWRLFLFAATGLLVVEWLYSQWRGAPRRMRPGRGTL